MGYNTCLDGAKLWEPVFLCVVLAVCFPRQHGIAWSQAKLCLFDITSVHFECALCQGRYATRIHNPDEPNRSTFSPLLRTCNARVLSTIVVRSCVCTNQGWFKILNSICRSIATSILPPDDNWNWLRIGVYNLGCRFVLYFRRAFHNWTFVFVF